MSDPEGDARTLAESSYAQALAQVAQPPRSSSSPSADPYGRTFTLVGGDLVIAPGADGLPDLAMVAGTDELAQGVQVLVGTPLGTDLFNMAFGFDLTRTLGQPKSLPQMRELIRLCVVKAIAQEPRIRQVRAIAFVDEKAYLTIHPEVTPEQQKALALEQRQSRRWSLDVQLDTGLGDQITAGIQGVGP